MTFLLGLFIGSTIFILGLVFGGVWGYGLKVKDVQDGEYEEDSQPSLKSEQIKVLFDDFGDFVDMTVQCYEHNSPLQLSVMSNDGIQIDLILADKQMHIEECFNIDNEG